MAQNKKVLVVGSFKEQIEVAKVVNGFVAKISNSGVDDPIRVSSEERELLGQIVVSTSFCLN